jgi:dihydrofolate reductase
MSPAAPGGRRGDGDEREVVMGRVRMSLSVSADGYLAGPGQSVEHPLGAGGEALHAWTVRTRAWRSLHGADGGDAGTVDDRVAAEHLVGVGATVMGRRMFGGEVPWGDDPWRGWWGDEPPFGHPVFVLTRHARPPLAAGRTTFHFVTDGPEAALAMARTAAGEGRDVSVAGGAATARRYLAAGHVDVMDLHVVPVLLGGGSRLLGDQPDLPARYRRDRVLHGDGVMHVRRLRRDG